MPAQYAATVVAALVFGFMTGLIVAGLAARGRQLDEQSTAARAFRDLLGLAERYVTPEHRPALLRRAADLWDSFDPLARQLTGPLTDRPRADLDGGERRHLAPGGTVAASRPALLDPATDLWLIRPRRGSDE